MGDAAEDILCSLDLSDDEKKVYVTVKEKFERHFIKRRNLIFERAKFNQRRQKEGESVNSFITDLHCLVEHCGYGELRKEMVRDRIVVGLLDATLSLKLQMDPELTLDKATAAARQSESVRNQQDVIRGEQKQNSVDALESKRAGEKKAKQPQNKFKSKHSFTSQTPPRQFQTQACTRCGKTHSHGKQHCPAREAVCNKCSKKGHFQSMCKTSKLAQVEAQPEEQEFLVTLEDAQSSVTKNPWEVTITLNEVPVQFKIDTGADVSAIPESVFKQLQDVSLTHSDRRLTGPSQHQLQVAGQFTATLKYGTKKTTEKIFVVKQLQQSLLGCPGIQSLNLIARINLVEDNKYVAMYPDLFKGLGTITGEYHISLREGAKPFALSTPRRVALPLMPKVKQELERMEAMGVITRVEQPTDWCAGIVVVPKPNGSLRICVDLTKLNESVRRERHILPAVDHILAQLSGATVFTKLDFNSGFWQIKLSEQSALYTTFITPFGRFCFKRLPFGITSVPEFFQQKISTILANLEGVVCMIDDVLIFGHNQEHDQRLKIVLSKLQKAGVTLNKTKCKFSQHCVKFLGQQINSEGIRPDPEKVDAIQQIAQPSNIKELRRFLGMTNHLSKFTPKLADTTECLRDLLSKKNHWIWGDSQQQAFEKIKQQLSSSPVLAIYDPQKDTTVAADASSYGLGAVITQIQSDGSHRAIPYASRALTSTEEKYTQIEKESLALTWACQRFSDYLIGKQFHILTDHKPLVSLLSSKLLDTLPLRVQRFRMRLMRFTYTISHVPGKELTVPDTLSRAPVSSPTFNDTRFNSEVDAFVNLMLEGLPATEIKLQQIQQAQKEDAICCKLIKFCHEGWPAKSLIPDPVKPYIHVAAELSVQNDLMRGNRIVIPVSLQAEMLEKLHSAH